MPVALKLFVTCPRGLESVLAGKLRALGARSVRPLTAGASCSGDLACAYRLCLGSRVASRVLMELAVAEAETADDMYAAVRAVAWERVLKPDGTLAVDFVGQLPGITNTMFGAQRAKDAVCDRMRELTGRRPDVDPAAPDLRINVSARRGRVTVSVDLSGEALHRRGYREPGVQTTAPLKENLAAGLLLLAGWKQVAERGGTLVDPMCGSGTLPIEAAMIAADIAPGLLRGRFGFERLLIHDPDVWEAVQAEARSRAAVALAGPLAYGSDHDPRAVELARACARRAGVETLTRFERVELADLVAPEGAERGLVVANPPYGERLATDAGLYELLGDRLRAGFDEWQAALLTSEEPLAAATGLPWRRTHALKNGPLDVALYVGAVRAARTRPQARAATPGVSADKFANRVRKNLRHLRKWVRREGVTCFRVYDADLPDFAVAVDLYEGAGADEGRTFVHVAEYEAPPTVDAGVAEARLAAAVGVLPELLDAEPADVFVKVRRRQRGTSQYERQSRRGVTVTVAEGGSLFEVNLSDYLDTGLFLDHRPLRLEVRRAAEGKRFLNLFAYTGAFTVHAAAGGAASTVTVDLSETYLAWSRRNLELNGLGGPAHGFVRADAREWLAAAAPRSFDLILLDPPTFSTSKRMEGTLDIQRDHVGLIRDAAALLAPGGVLYFSTNLRSFRLDAEALGGLEPRDITPETIPPDFARRPRVHACWRVPAP